MKLVRIAHGLGRAVIVTLTLISQGAAEADDGPFVPEPGVKGYGVRGVAGATLRDMIANCADAKPSGDATEQLKWEECSQLRRSLKTQPGNATNRR